MKILQVISSVNPEGGGPIELLEQMGLEMVRLGHEIEVASLDPPYAPWVSGMPFKVHAFGPAFMKYSYSRLFAPWLSGNAKKYDCVIVHGIWQYASFGVWLSLRNSKTPYFVWAHGMLDPYFKNAYPLKHLKKMIYWPWAEYRVLRDARVVLFSCEEERLLAKKSFRLYRCNEAVVNYGIKAPHGDAASLREGFQDAFPETRKKRIILFLGRIHPKKGCDILLEAFSKAVGMDDSLRLVLAGPDPVGWVKELRTKAKELGIEGKVTWTGMLSGDLKWGAFQASEAFVLPSHQENFGIAVIEALSCGKPVLISNKVNIWREIAGDGAGLVADDTTAGTAGLLEEFLSMSLQERQRMGSKAKKCFEERFEVNKATKSLIDMLREQGVG